MISSATLAQSQWAAAAAPAAVDERADLPCASAQAATLRTTAPAAMLATTGRRRPRRNNSRGFNTIAAMLAIAATMVGNRATPALVKMGTTAIIVMKR